MARIHFTARTIDGLKPNPGKREEYWDESTPGFGLRISPEGRKSWVLIYRFAGRQRRLTLGTYPAMELASARERARRAQFETMHGRDPATEKQVDREAETFAGLVTEYLERHAKPKKKSWREDERILCREFLPVWKNCKARSITRREVLSVLDKIVEREAPILANKALAVLRKVFNFAVQRDIVEANPCWNVPAPGKIRSRDRVLSMEELRALWTALEREELLSSSFYRLLLWTAQVWRSCDCRVDRNRSGWRMVDVAGCKNQEWSSAPRSTLETSRPGTTSFEAACPWFTLGFSKYARFGSDTGKEAMPSTHSR